MIKLAAFDLDGTILNDAGELTNETKDYLLNLIKEDILVVPCSARPYSEFPDWFKEEKSIPYLVCLNGGEVIDNSTDVIIVNNKLTGDVALKATKYLENKTKLFTFNIDESMFSTMEVYEYLKPQNTPFKDGMFNYVNRYYTPHYRDFLKTSDNIGKIHVCVDSDEEREMLLQYAQDIEGVSVTSSHPQNIELLHPHASKGDGLKSIMDIFNINKNEIITVGDNENDISLIKAAKHSIAMVNGKDSLKAHAKYITELDNNHDGAIIEIDRIIKKQEMR